MQGMVKDLRDREVSDWVDDYFDLAEKAAEPVDDWSLTEAEMEVRKNALTAHKAGMPKKMKQAARILEENGQYATIANIIAYLERHSQ